VEHGCLVQIPSEPEERDLDAAVTIATITSIDSHSLGRVRLGDLQSPKPLLGPGRETKKPKKNQSRYTISFENCIFFSLGKEDPQV
jgi:hypothetical protein